MPENGEQLGLGEEKSQDVPKNKIQPPEQTQESEKKPDNVAALEEQRTVKKILDSLTALREEAQSDELPISDEERRITDEGLRFIAEQGAEEAEAGIIRLPSAEGDTYEKGLEEDPKIVFEEIKASLRELAENGEDFEDETEDSTPSGEVLYPDEVLTNRALRILSEMYPDSQTMQAFVNEARKKNEEDTQDN